MPARGDAVCSRDSSEPPTGDASALVEDGDASIEALVYLDSGLRVATALRPGQELDVVGRDRDRVVVADDAAVLEAEDRLRVEPDRPRAIRGGGIRRGLRKARIVTRQELTEEGVGPRAISDLRQPQFRAQPILESAKEPLDATFRLRAAGRNPADSQLVEGAGDLRRRGAALQLLVHREGGLFGPMEDAMAIAVDRDGDALGVHECAQHQEVPMGIFLVAKDGGGHFPGGIVYDGEQSQTRAPLLEPVVVAAIQLDQQAGRGHALSAPPVSRRASPPGTAEPGRAEDAVDGGLGEHEAFAFSQELTKVRMVDSGVGGLGELDDPDADGFSHASRRGATAVPVDQHLRTVPAISASEAPDLTGRESQEIGGFCHQKLATVQGMEYDELLLCAVRQGNHPPRIRLGAGRTFSLNP